MESVEIEAGSLSQVHRTRRGKLVQVDDDVGNVARDLTAIDPGLRLRYSPDEELFVVYHHRVAADGSEQEQLVTTSRTCDQRIVARIREIDRPGYDYGTELERLDDEADRRRDHERRESVGPYAERLSFALSRDLQRDESPVTRSSRAVVPRGL